MRTLGQLACVSACLGLMTLAGGCRATNGWVMNNSGMGYYQRGNYAAARSEFARAVADDPYHPDYRHNLAMAMQKQGDLAGSEQVLRHNLTIDPMHQPTYHALSQNLVQQQRTAEAQELITAWADTQPYISESHIEMAWLQRELGNHAGAEQSLRQALQVEPNHPVALAHLGQVYHETGRPDQAAAFYQRSLVSRWDQPQVHSRLTTLSSSSPSRGDMRRSAMVQNPTFIQSASMSPGPVGLDHPIVSSTDLSTGANIAAMPLNDPMPTSRREARRARRHGSDAVATFPLPTYGNTVTAWSPTETVSSAPMMAFQPPMIANQMMLPESTSIIAEPAAAAPTVASGPVLIPQADPAHSTGITASLPVVEPH